MERLTANNYSSLVESYSAVYNEDLRSQLNEEQQIQEFLEFVDTLLEEGYDLSEYTYDELYEDWKSQLGKAILQYGAKTAAKYGPRVGSALKTGAKDVAKIPLKAGETAWKTGMKVLQNPIGAVAATAGAIDLARHGGKSWTGQALSSAGKALSGGDKKEPATAKPQPEKPKSQSLKILGGKVVGYDHFDMFDAVKGYLIDEGYAETEEAAIKIMANMSEEWREDIFKIIGE
jgi:hypothetical protein